MCERPPPAAGILPLFTVVLSATRIEGPVLGVKLPFMLLESVLEPDEARDDAGLPQVADVLVPVALDNAYSYRVPPGL
ncbi:MAG: hypothetical protein QOG66_1219, partial [Methylobacteriaceae bacterium]|nr:hypothetical protein [Methylobacteriaceae bacterium]